MYYQQTTMSHQLPDDIGSARPNRPIFSRTFSQPVAVSHATSGATMTYKPVMDAPDD